MNIIMNVFNVNTIFISIFLILHIFTNYAVNCATVEEECEFPPKSEEDLTHLSHVRRKRLTDERGIVCLEDYPYTASIRLNNKHWCGGAIVSSQWILSAAQCFDYVTADEVTVRTGSVFRDQGGKLYSVVDIRKHDKYKEDQYYAEHNLALVKVNIDIKENPRTQIVELPKHEAPLPRPVREIVITGYGAVETGQVHYGVNQELRRMLVKEVSRSECKMMYGNEYELQSDHVCLKSTEDHVALCSGDTGNPAVYFTGMNRKGVLYGIAVFSGIQECAHKDKPGVFTKVSMNRDWIDSVIVDTNITNCSASEEASVPQNC